MTELPEKPAIYMESALFRPINRRRGDMLWKMRGARTYRGLSGRHPFYFGSDLLSSLQLLDLLRGKTNKQENAGKMRMPSEREF
jgi:hypothetical protein